MRALAFDAYGTLFDVMSVTALCEELFPGRGGALAHLWRAKQLEYSWLRSLMDRYVDFWRLTEDGLICAAETLALDLLPERRRLLMDAYLCLDVFPDVKPSLQALRRQGCRLAILSNGAPAMLAAAARRAGILELLDVVVSADEVGIYKPSPRIYQRLLERLPGGNAEVGFVSANSWDVQGATAAGLQTFWIQRSAADPPEALGFPATRVVRTLTDLGDLRDDRSTDPRV